MLAWLAQLIAPLNAVLFRIGNDAVSWAELLGFVSGAACVWLTVRSSIHNFWVGIANCTFFLVLFATARLWADGGLQIVYIVLGIIGWWQWLHGGADRGALTVRRATPRTLAGCVGFVVVATWGLTVLLTAVHDSAPFWDALTTAISLAAQYLLNAKRVETWLFWMAADVVYIPLYAAKGLVLTAVVYTLFLGMTILGLRAWLAASTPGRTGVSAPDGTTGSGPAAAPAGGTGVPA
ncbi:nicotinamide riboside transporter PnuC [Plantactinospora sp. KBS50]|uniref:nicotinamide riboside transporter PnuC n=1 Tax=Plantactinospora sp. KBS50 TaxID=2024580 RepID=UPI000BAAEA22|nr:nicotinamide riboside transporter PnuC [Plantactinospora sp. KBS50]ASW55423.1 nicotinamide mononucleotide transporter PnuC [Plantactinospora sp. KBS50]